MKKAKRKIFSIFALVLLVGCLYVAPIGAVNRFSFSFPNIASGSLRSSGAYKRTSASAYVYPDVTTVTTKYYLAPSSTTTTAATNVETLSTRTKKYFTWKSGYGGSGQYYKLCGYPDASMGSWNAYSVAGDWVD